MKPLPKNYFPSPQAIAFVAKMHGHSIATDSAVFFMAKLDDATRADYTGKCFIFDAGVQQGEFTAAVKQKKAAENFMGERTNSNYIHYHPPTENDK
jgi:hypothetical protein